MVRELEGLLRLRQPEGGAVAVDACALVMDRDENATINIETEAARSADSLNGRGDEVRPGRDTDPAVSVKRLLDCLTCLRDWHRF